METSVRGPLRLGGGVAKKGRSRGFESREQRLPATPPLEPDTGAGIMSVVRARYRDAMDMLFGAPVFVLNAAGCEGGRLCGAERAGSVVPGLHPKQVGWSTQREESDQVVPGAVELAGGDCCECTSALWTAGGVGPDLMLRKGEELSERIITLYGRAVDPATSNVNYSSLVHSKDFTQYLESARKLRYFDPLLLTDEERKAFFLNVYNSLMIHAIAVMSKPRTMFERIQLYNTAAYDIGGRSYSLNMIEHGVLRANRPGSGPFAQVPFAGSDARKMCALPVVDPRIHFALNCGARSCPAVRFYEAKTIDSALDSATHVYLQDMGVDPATRTVTLSKIMLWYQADFSDDGSLDSLLHWTMPYLDAEKRQNLTKLLDSKRQEKASFKVVYADYDWTINDSSV